MVTDLRVVKVVETFRLNEDSRISFREDGQERAVLPDWARSGCWDTRAVIAL